MTDNEIIKALECCGVEGNCKGCPYHDISFCQDEIDKDALDLIERQQAEIERYKDLEEQGRLIELPCKVGDKVWKIVTQHNNYDDYPHKIVIQSSFILENLNEMGDRVFLTKEEAEAKLKEMVGESNDR